MMKKAVLISLVMLLVMSFASGASARALGYGIIFEGVVPGEFGRTLDKSVSETVRPGK